MSSHYAWQERVVAEHDATRPFAPENGTPLKFKAGDPVIFTNYYGISFRLRVTGFYQPEAPCSLYATGRRYLLNSSSPWYPVRESELEFDEGRDCTLNDGYLAMIWEQIDYAEWRDCEAYAVRDALCCCPGRHF
jgi:hypothetical protein